MAGNPYPPDGTNFNGPPPPPAPVGPAGQPMNTYFNPGAFSMGDAWHDTTAYGGKARTYNPDGSVNPGGADLATQRFQNMGQGMANRTAYQADYNPFVNSMQAADQSRGAENDALGLLRGAANGTAPSQAAILAKQAGADNLAAGQALAAGARGGPMQVAAAQANAAAGVGAAGQRTAETAAAARAGEMAQARGAYMGGAGQIRQGDYAGAGLNLGKTGQDLQNEQFQRGLNQSGQLTAEGMGQRAQEDQMNSSMGEHKIAESGYESQKQQNEHSQDRDTGVIGSVINGIAGGLGGLLSDPRAKNNLAPLASAAPMGSLPPWMPANAFPASLLVSDPLAKYFGTEGDNRAPGSADWDRYGVSSATEGAPDWSRGGATKPAPSSGGGGASNMFSGFAKGFKLSDPDSKSLLEPMGNAGGDPAGSMAMGGDGIDVMGSFKKLNGQEIGSVMHQNGGLLTSDPRAKKEVADTAFAAGEKSGIEAAHQVMGVPWRIADAASKGGFAQRANGAVSGLNAGLWHESPAASLLHSEADADRDEAARAGASAGRRAAVVAPPAEMMDALGSGKTFQYKPGIPGEDPSKQHFGTTTTDLKATPMGASMVTRDPATGYEAIDTREAIGPMLASVGNLNARLRALEHNTTFDAATRGAIAGAAPPLALEPLDMRTKREKGRR